MGGWLVENIGKPTNQPLQNLSHSGKVMGGRSVENIGNRPTNHSKTPATRHNTIAAMVYGADVGWRLDISTMAMPHLWCAGGATSYSHNMKNIKKV